MRRVAWTPQRGFTIVELLVVIVVIAILAAITIVSYNGMINRAGTTAVQSDLRNAATQLEVDRAWNGSYPSDDSDANNGQGLPAGGGTRYEYTSDGETYCLTATSDRSGVGPYRISSGGGIEAGACPGHTGSDVPAGVPGAPVFVQNYNFFGGEGHAAWNAPASTGDSAITSYRVRIVSEPCAELDATFSLPALANGASMTGSGEGDEPYYSFDRLAGGKWLFAIKGVAQA